MDEREILTRFKAGTLGREEAARLLSRGVGETVAPAEVAEPEPSALTDIVVPPLDGYAVVGLAGRYPMAPDPETFWELLRDGRDTSGDGPVGRPGGSPLEPGQRGHFLDGIEEFDAGFFGLTAREGALMDPQERLFLETAWEALEDAGCAGPRLDALTGPDGEPRAVGVFVGVSSHDYALLAAESWVSRGPREMPGSGHGSLPGRLAALLGLSGPGQIVDTGACSALTAVHLAVESLRRGECAAAVAGGVELLLHSSRARDGAGEGVGAVVLKRLDRALADGDRVHAVVRDTSSGFRRGNAGSLAARRGGTGVAVVAGRAGEVFGGRGADLDASAVESGEPGDVSGGWSAGGDASVVGLGETQAVSGGWSAGGDASVVGLGETHAVSRRRDAGGDAARGGLSETRGMSGRRDASVVGLTDTRDVSARPSASGDASVVGLGDVNGRQGVVGVGPVGVRDGVRRLVGDVGAVGGVVGVTAAVFQVGRGVLAPAVGGGEAVPWGRARDGQGREVPRRAVVDVVGEAGLVARAVVEEFVGLVGAPEGGGGGGDELVVLSAPTPGHLAATASRLADWLAKGMGGVVLADVARALRVGRAAMPCRIAHLGRDVNQLVAELRRFADTRAGGGGLRCADLRAGAVDPLGLGAAPETRDYLAALWRGGRLEQLTQLWLSGVDVDWAAMEEGTGGGPGAVPPPSVFLRQPLWLDPVEEQAG
ncbi:beta-ketoacyl synthase N-terminal-like domain-containing protein [Streptomyces sp. NPDC051954]|uniref:beta-ketoacyl [acyl carrier protein] synthase domain-containing protein n=1 Tax=Streptomyces sp. NPDC051954 TaxID=3155524 RepID=UPI00343472E0